MLHRRLLALALSLFFVATPVAVVPSAFAASATQTGYDETNGLETEEETPAEEPADDSGVSPAETEQTAEASPSTAATTSSLPFTGLEAGLIAAAGLGLAGTGLVLRRAAREQS